ncbi:MAG TPA: CBS domain-containing protein, partial [Myxococcota bacterium]|nr:CBS domain-containing protein [Myxococcota bacterium]
MRLREFMQAPVYACSPTATLAAAAGQMEAHNVGSLVVIPKTDRQPWPSAGSDPHARIGRAQSPS